MTQENTQATEIKWKDYPQKQKINGINYRINPSTNAIIKWTGEKWLECEGDDIPTELKHVIKKTEINTTMITENRTTETNREITTMTETAQTDFTICETKDESQIVAEIEGHILKEFVYISHGKPVLTYAGVKQLAIIQGDIHIGEPIIEKMDDCWIAKASAHNVKNNLKTWGISSQPLFLKMKTGELASDEFAMQKAVSKAIRNAIRALMQEQYILKTIQGWMNINK